ncbi:MAG: hypothetical protein Q8O87_04150 [bacterium]|nr:hypothetical protein [bacterium]
MLFKTLTREEVLELLMMAVLESIPKNMEGSLSANIDKAGNAEIFFIPKVKKIETN